MKKRLLLLMMVVASCTTIFAQPANGFYRVKNNAGAGSMVYAQMESNRYSSVMGTASSALTDASTVFYLELGSANADGSYPISQLRSQMVNCPSQTAYIPMLLASLDDETLFNQLKAAFMSGVTSTADKARIAAFTLAQFQAWASAIKVTMNLKADNGSYVVYDTCEDFPCGADMNAAMNVVWANASLQAMMAGLVDKVLPTTAEKKELNATFKSMLSAFRFGGTIYLSQDSNGEFSFTSDGTAANAHWDIEDIDATNYFAVAPDASFTDGNGKYYASIYLDFAVQLPEGVTAWYVSSVDGSVAKCEQLEGNVVPRFLPVILECSSTSAADNKLTPVPMTSALWSLGNTTRGKSLLDNNNVRTKTSLSDNSSVNFYPQTYAGMKNDKTHFRVLSVNGGKLGFYVYSGTTMGVNKAYLYLASGGSGAKSFMLDFGSLNNDVVTAIKSVETNKGNADVYDLQGRRVTNFNRDLPRGIYVVNGKKIVVK